MGRSKRSLEGRLTGHGARGCLPGFQAYPRGCMVLPFTEIGNTGRGLGSGVRS